MKRRAAIFFLLCSLPALAATPEDELRSTFERFVVAQNAHDASAVSDLLLDSPSFLWITRGNAVWGRAEALKRFEALYNGTWRLEPDMASFRVVFVNPTSAQIFVPVAFSIGPKDHTVRPTPFLMNQILTKVGDTWRISSILPIPVPVPSQ
jgi:hypothetical protein